MKVVILCGGEGTRLKEHTESIPQPLVEIGGKPILWHIMKIFSFYGIRDFILCLGYKGYKIKEFFVDYEAWKYHDFKLMNGKVSENKHNYDDIKDWNIIFADTGLDTNTGGRIKRIEKYIKKDDIFLCTYGDGLSEIDLNKLIEFHKTKKKIATVTCVKPMSQFGIVSLDEKGDILEFQEKPIISNWINGGFFVFNREVFKYIEENDVLETQSLVRLVRNNQIAGYKYEGFWACMDTYKDTIKLNEIWKSGKSPWHKWSDNEYLER